MRKYVPKPLSQDCWTSEFNGFSEDPELTELLKSLDLLGLDSMRNYDRQIEKSRASTGHAAAAMAMHEQNLLAEKNGGGNKRDDDSRKPPSSSISGSANSKSPIRRLKKTIKNHRKLLARRKRPTKFSPATKS